MNLREEISKVFGLSIREGKWQQYVAPLDREGEPTRKHMSQVLFLMAQEFETVEKQYEDIKLRLENNGELIQALTKRIYTLEKGSTNGKTPNSSQHQPKKVV